MAVFVAGFVHPAGLCRRGFCSHGNMGRHALKILVRRRVAHEPPQKLCRVRRNAGFRKSRLKTKGFLDEAKYLEQIAELNSKINKLSREQHKIVRSDGEDDMIDQIKDIASIIENGMELMTEFNEIMFESLVEKIIVINQNELEFHLYGGLKFTERLV